MDTSVSVQQIESLFRHNRASEGFSKLNNATMTDEFAPAVSQSQCLVSSCIYILKHWSVDMEQSSLCIDFLRCLTNKNSTAIRPFVEAGAFDLLTTILKTVSNEPNPHTHKLFDPIFTLICDIATSHSKIIGSEGSHWLFFLELLRKVKGEKRNRVATTLYEMRDAPVTDHNFLKPLANSLMICRPPTMDLLVETLHAQVTRFCVECTDDISNTVTVDCLVTLMTVDSPQTATLLLKTASELCQSDSHKVVVATTPDLSFERIFSNLYTEPLKTMFVDLMNLIWRKVPDENFGIQRNQIMKCFQE